MQHAELTPSAVPDCVRALRGILQLSDVSDYTSTIACHACHTGSLQGIMQKGLTILSLVPCLEEKVPGWVLASLYEWCRRSG